jgi:Family of unknown function (DUF5572)
MANAALIASPRKYNVQVDIPAYRKWREHHVKSPSASHGVSTEEPIATGQPEQPSSAEKPPYPMSFNRLVELITEGKEVPGIKEIPDTLLEGQSSQSTTTQRRKPWEQA